MTREQNWWKWTRDLKKRHSKLIEIDFGPLKFTVHVPSARNWTNQCRVLCVSIVFSRTFTPGIQITGSIYYLNSVACPSTDMSATIFNSGKKGNTCPQELLRLEFKSRDQFTTWILARRSTRRREKRNYPFSELLRSKTPVIRGTADNRSTKEQHRQNNTLQLISLQKQCISLQKQWWNT